MQNDGKQGRSVLWAVDPFEDHLDPPVGAVREMAEGARRAGSAVLPVHVVTVLEKQWELGEVPLLLEVQAAVDRYVSKFGLGDEVRARVIVDETGTRASAIRAVLELAEAEGADWIAVSCHGRGGVERLVLGSFAELLVENSPVPVLFLPRQEAKPEARAARVALFATDLSSAAHAAFTRFLPIASSQRLELAIFHAIHYPVPSLDFGMGPVGLGPVLPETFVEDQTAWARTLGERLVAEAQARGVRARFCLHVGLVPSITGRAVLAAARKERARMIVMPSTSGPVIRFIGGSVAQEVFRTGRTLTWLFGPRSLDLGSAEAA